MEGAFPVTMLPGDGVGPELMHAVKEVFKVSSPGGGQSPGREREIEGSWEGGWVVVVLTCCMPPHPAIWGYVPPPTPEGCLCPSGVPGVSPE